MCPGHTCDEQWTSVVPLRKWTSNNSITVRLMDRSNALFRLLFRVEAHSTTARVADYGCQREQRAVLSNRLDRPPTCPPVILLLAEIRSKNNTRVGRPRWNTRCAIPPHRLDRSLRNLPRIPSTNSYRLCVYYISYLSYYIIVLRFHIGN